MTEGKKKSDGNVNDDNGKGLQLQQEYTDGLNDYLNSHSIWKRSLGNSHSYRMYQRHAAKFIDLLKKHLRMCLYMVGKVRLEPVDDVIEM